MFDRYDAITGRPWPRRAVRPVESVSNLIVRQPLNLIPNDTGPGPMDASGESLLEFPCDFPVKIMGEASTEFETLVIAIIKRHATDFKEESVRSRASRNGRYISLTATIRARDQAQLDGIYRDLSAHEQVLFAL